MSDIITLIILTIFANSTLWSPIGITLKNTSMVDIAWAIGPMLCCWILYMSDPGQVFTLIFTLMISIWALRLAMFLWLTRIRHQHQDPRYSEIESKWTGNIALKTIRHYYMQALFLCGICSCLIPVFMTPLAPITWAQILAIGLFLMAIIGETIADWQLYQFKQSKQKGLLSTGLWSRSRHPNYFFEWLVWISLALYSLQSPQAIIAWLSPLLLWVIFNKMTGPYTEKLSIKRHGQLFKKYQDTVPFFIPSFKSIKRSR
ncbi:MAG: hypothetical protein CL521_03595 [Actinobacteria bacterium]|nr:hypothetical protein [Actinomycetota bacterium]